MKIPLQFFAALTFKNIETPKSLYLWPIGACKIEADSLSNPSKNSK